MITRAEIEALSSKTVRLNELDDQLSTRIQRISEQFRLAQVSRVDAEIVPGAQLAWSGLHGHWRFIVRYGDGIVELLQTSPEIRTEVFTCGAMAKLVKRALGRCPQLSSKEVTR